MKFKLLVLLFFVNISYVFTQTIYTNFDDFKNAAKMAQPGDEIVLAKGRYKAESITIENVNATAENPVIIRAEEIGQDTLDNGTYFDLRHSSHIIIQGFVINITEKSTTFKIQTCNHIRITQNVLNGEGEDYYKDDGTDRNSSVWISIQSLWDDLEGLSHDNKIDHNIFMNKHTLGNMIKIDGTNSLYVSKNDVIEYNYFKNMGPRADNEMEAIRIGWSAMSQSDGNCTVQNNLFEECNGDPEIISVKCNKNNISHNTFRRCQGTLSLRHGNETTVDGNFFFGEGAEGTGGVRIYGSDHRIINNYFEGLTGTKWDAPITLTEGDADEGDGGLSKHFRIERAIIANNTLYKNTHGIEIGYDNNGKYSKPARNVVMAYNIVQADTNPIVKYINSPDNMQWVNNVFYATDDATIGDGVSFTSEQVQELYPNLLYNETLAYAKATETTPVFSPDTDLVGTIVTDFEGQQRSSTTNFGADQFSSSPRIYKPLTPADVGPSLGEYLYVSVSTIEVPKKGESYTVSISANVEWGIEKSADWVTLTPSTGDGYGKVSLSVTENTTGFDRSATISVKSENTTEDQIIRVINLTQLATEPNELTVDKTELIFDASSSSQTITITSNINWSLTNESSWITISDETGTGNKEVTITVSENESAASRNSEITLTDSEAITHTISVVQNGVNGSEEKLVIIGAIASTEQSEKDNVAINVFDGDLTNRWSGDGDGAYIDIELQDTSTIAYIKVGLYKGNERHSYFDILTSENGVDFVEGQMDITSELTDELLVIYDIPDVKAKYVRIVGHGNSNSSWNSFTEFELWGWVNSTPPNKVNAVKQRNLIYPNPSTGSFYITNPNWQELNIYNILGKHVFKTTNLNQNRIQTQLEKGKYLLILSSENFNYTSILIVN